MAMSVVYTTFAGEIVHENRGGVERDYMPDPLGSTAALLDSTQAQTDIWVYWPYGEVKSRAGKNATPFGFVGLLGYFTDAVKSIYVRARYLRPDLGRWQTVDELWPSESDYGYCKGAPSTYSDPTGTSVFDRITGGLPCGIDDSIGRFIKCTGNGRCVDFTNEYAISYLVTGNKFEKCASCVSMFLCYAIAAGEYASLVGAFLPNPVSDIGGAAAECVSCQNRCMIQKWRLRRTHFWKLADRTCRMFGNSSKECCLASVRAEQDGYDRCATLCCRPLSLIPFWMRYYFAKDILRCCD